MKILLSLFIFFIVNCCCNQTSEKKIEFIYMPDFNSSNFQIFNGDTLYTKGKRFIIRNYSDSKQTVKSLDSFVVKSCMNDCKDYYSYTFTFYKESKKTNLENLKANPRDIDRYSLEHDLIYTYDLQFNRLVSRFKFINGKVVEPNNKIKVEDVDSLGNK